MNQIKRLENAIDQLNDPYAKGLVALAVHELKQYHKLLSNWMDTDEPWNKTIEDQCLGLLKRNSE